MFINNIDFHNILISDIGIFACSSENIFYFNNNFFKNFHVIAKLENIENLHISNENDFLIAFDTLGNIFKIPLSKKSKVHKYVLNKKTNCAQIYLNENFGIVPDYKGNIFATNFEQNSVYKIAYNKGESYYAIFPSIESNCFLVQGVDANDNTFIRKYALENNQIKLLSSYPFGDTTLTEHNLNLKLKETIYFIDCQNEIFSVYSYNEITNKITKHFELARLEELWEIISHYVSLRFSNEYDCFVITRTDKVQLFSPDGVLLQETNVDNGNIGSDFENSAFDAYILNDKLYINTIIGVQEEPLEI